MSLKFGYWALILSGGYVLSTIPQRTEWSITANIRLAQTAKRVGFDYTLLPARFTSLECGATETRKTQEQAIASVEQTRS